MICHGNIAWIDILQYFFFQQEGKSTVKSSRNYNLFAISSFCSLFFFIRTQCTLNLEPLCRNFYRILLKSDKQFSTQMSRTFLIAGKFKSFSEKYLASLNEGFLKESCNMKKKISN